MIAKFARLEFKLFTRPSKSDFFYEFIICKAAPGQPVFVKSVRQDKRAAIRSGALLASLQ